MNLKEALLTNIYKNMTEAMENWSCTVIIGL